MKDADALRSFLLIWGLATLFWFCVVWPLRFKFRFQQKCPLDVKPRPELVPDNYPQLSGPLTSLGFQFAGSAEVNGLSQPLGQTAVLLFYNYEDHSVAAVILNLVKDAACDPNRIILEFTTELTDKSRISTFNGSHYMVVKPTEYVCQKLRENDSRVLYALHRAFVAKVMTGKPGIEKKPVGQPIMTHLSDVFERAQQTMVDSGYFHKDEKNKCLRLTTSGAFKWIWRLIWPFRIILNMRRANEMNRLIECLRQSDAYKDTMH